MSNIFKILSWQHHDESKTIYYFDETLVNADHIKQTVWEDQTI
jgi:hypothetical protein